MQSKQIFQTSVCSWSKMKIIEQYICYIVVGRLNVMQDTWNINICKVWNGPYPLSFTDTMHICVLRLFFDHTVHFNIMTTTFGFNCRYWVPITYPVTRGAPTKLNPMLVYVLALLPAQGFTLPWPFPGWSEKHSGAQVRSEALKLHYFLSASLPSFSWLSCCIHLPNSERL